MSVLAAQRRPLVVGLDFKEASEDFISSCISLAEKLHANVELVHAVHASSFDFMGPADAIVNPYYNYEKAFAALEEQDAHERLEAIKKSFPASIEVRAHVVREAPATALLSIAQELRAGLIVCGLGAGTAPTLFQGVSTAFSLAAHGDLPLMLLPLAGVLDFREPPRMLIADKLEVEGRFALENALRLAEDLATAAIFHVHVHPRRADLIDDMARRAQKLLGREQTEAFEGKLYLEQIRSRIEGELLYRFHNSEGAQQLAASYETRLAFGEEAEELQKICEETKARLLVFGRHHLIHRKSFSLGKLPCEALLREKAAIVVVPDAHRRVMRERSF